MRQISALELLNKEVFGQKIFSENNEVLYTETQKITPEIIMKLYFKNIFIDDIEIKEDVVEEKTDDTDTGSIGFNRKEKSQEAEVENRLKGQDESIFDEQEALEVQKYAEIMAIDLELSEAEIKNIKLAGYIHNIGDSFLTKEAKEKEDYLETRAKLGYEYTYNKLKYPEAVSRVTKEYYKKSDLDNFDLSNKTIKNFPYSHIVTIVAYYVKHKGDYENNEDILKKMIRIGDKLFNIYLLHRFIRKIRELENDN